MGKLHHIGPVVLILTVLMLAGTARAEDFSKVNSSIMLLESALEQMPLFSPNRQPPVVVEEIEVEAPIVVPINEQKAAPSAISNWKLVGVLRSDESDLAIIRDEANNEVLRLKTGEMRDGWVLTSVGQRKAVFSNGTASTELKFASEENAGVNQ